MLQTSVEMVNPGGTGRPAFVISASPDPLPPSRSFIVRLPSALPFAKEYTYFLDFAAAVRGFRHARLPRVDARGCGLAAGAARFPAAFLDVKGRSVMNLAIEYSRVGG